MKKISYPNTKFLIFTDPHYFSKKLWGDFDKTINWLEEDKKFLLYSHKVIDYAVSQMCKVNADFVIISGDLSKDGEYESHIDFSNILKRLQDSGKKVYVVPGNHDINNGLASKVVGDKSEFVKSVNSEDFEKIYYKFGYQDAISKDKKSLSYLSEPIEGLLVLNIDSNMWRENKKGEYCKTDGIIYSDTLKWIEDIFRKYNEKQIIVNIHHAVLEHFRYQKKYYPEFLIKNNKKFAQLMVKYGVQLVFTGHYHAQDITKENINGLDIYDIETGSFATYPLPWRECEIINNKLIIKSHIMKKPLIDGFTSSAYSKNLYQSKVRKMAKIALSKYRIPIKDQNIIIPIIVDSYFSHLKGDEKKLDFKKYKLNKLSFIGKILFLIKKRLIVSWMTDIPPEDNNVEILLNR